VSSDAVAFVLKGYPRLSETFIAQEILALEQRGLDVRIFSLRHPTDPFKHPIHREIRAPVRYLPEHPIRETGRVMRAWGRARRRPGYGTAFKTWAHDMRRRPTVVRLRAFAQALVLAYDLPAEVSRIHAHFLHTPASVARYASLITGLPWSCSAHAVDIWSIPDWEKAEKIGDMEWLTTCTKRGRDHLARLAPAPDRIGLAYHGLDFSRFPPPAGRRSNRDGRDGDDPAIILSVGRAVEKKGFGVLISALALLPDTLHWRFIHIGGGALLPALKRQAEANGLASRITWMGPQPQDVVIEQYRTADLFVLASTVAANGDQDGLPNVLMEAQSQKLACVSTRVSAIPELIDDGKTGLLVSPDDDGELAGALVRLISDGELRSRLGEEGYDRVRAEFSHEQWIDGLLAKFTAGQSPDQLKARP